MHASQVNQFLPLEETHWWENSNVKYKVNGIISILIEVKKAVKLDVGGVNGMKTIVKEDMTTSDLDFVWMYELQGTTYSKIGTAHFLTSVQLSIVGLCSRCCVFTAAQNEIRHVLQPAIGKGPDTPLA